MPLIQCPECSNSVSNTAAACPHCGAPVARAATVRDAIGTWTRLRDFRLTVRKLRRELRGGDDDELRRIKTTTDRLGKWTWNLFYAQLVAFAFGIAFLSVALILLYKGHVFPKPA